MAFKHHIQGDIKTKHLYAGASLLALVASAGVVHAADAAATTAAADTGASVSEVIVTGTRQTGVKAVDSAAPIQVVGGEALHNVGQPDLIQTLSQNLPSFNAQAYGSDTAALTLSAALRGLSPNDTLVLVDGKRRHTTANIQVDSGAPYTGSATTDLSFIPVAAIDHVEVLQDGAAAQYGSDAIAGVVNIILKKADHGGSISLTGGEYYEGDGDTGSWSINKGFSLGGGKGFINVTAEEVYHDFSRQGACDVRFSNPLTGCSLNPVQDKNAPVANAIDLAGLPNAPGYPYVNNIYGDPQYNIYKLFFNGGYDLGDGIEFYANGSYGHRDSSAYENYRKPSKVTILGDSVADSTIPDPSGFEPREAIKEDDYSMLVGLKGAVWGWNWDASTTFGDDRSRVSTINSGNLAYLNQFGTGTTPVNFFDGTFETSEWTSNLDFNRDFAVGLASPLNVALGGEIRRDTFQIGQGEVASYFNGDGTFQGGAQSYPGFQPQNAIFKARTNYSTYLDFAVDPIAGLHIDAAGRYEHYTDFGDTEIGKVTARYDFNPKIAIRGTISSGFRAPTLAEEYYSSVNVAPGFEFVQLPPNAPAAQIAGFQPLKPELSHNYSVGFVAHPIDRLQLTVDLYEIIIRDRIVNSGNLIGNDNGPTVAPALNAAVAAHGDSLVGVTYSGINIFSNAANTRTRGVEFTATYASDFGEWGHVNWSLGFNYTQTDITKLTPLPCQDVYPTPSAASCPAVGLYPTPPQNLNFVQTSILTPTSITALTTAVPREKAVLGAFWTKDRWSANIRETIYGPTSQIVSPNTPGSGANATNLVIPTTGITDLDIGYQITKSLKLDVGANNLFDIKPPVVPFIPGVGMADGNNVYREPDTFSPYGINGGYYYGRVTFTF